MKSAFRCILFPVLGSLFFMHAGYGQNIGLPFLRIGVGARQAGLGDTFTGIGDDVHALYWNPGGLGHLRRWQWATSYNRWFTDVYQASVSYVGQFRAPGSHKTAVGAGACFIGMPEWDATGGSRPPVSASHFMINAALGQRLDWLHPCISVGFNLKMIQSQLDAVSATGFAGDMGILIRPGRFYLGDTGMGLFEYGIVSFGAALSHVGSKMTFDEEATSLPQTWRGGASLKLGRYGGWSLLLAADVIGVRERDITMGYGAELWWKDVLGGRIGYKADGEDLGGLTFGFGLRWDDVMNGLLGLPTRFGDAFEIALSDAGYGDVLQQTYRGSLNHYSVAPEPFSMNSPSVVHSYDMRESSVVRLFWEEAVDPDPFDEVGYLLFMDRNRSRLKRAIHVVERDMGGFLNSDLCDSLLLCEFVNATSYVSHVQEGGVYYWAVAAYDLSRHVRLARRGREEIGQFVVQVPDLIVRDIRFEPTSWITTTPEQGTFSLTLANEGSGPSEQFGCVILDTWAEGSGERDTLMAATLPPMPMGGDTVLALPWYTDRAGRHRIEAALDPENEVLELDETNNRFTTTFLTVPKGEVFAVDTVEVMATGFDSTEIPMVPEVYFNAYSAEVDSFYYTDMWVLPPVLSAIAARMKDNPAVQLHIMGSIDHLSGEEDPDLADERARSVRRILGSKGVDGSRLHVETDHEDKILGRRPMPVDSMDAVWLMEQNRHVTFSVEQEYEEAIFGPFKVGVDTTLKEDSVKVTVHVHSPGLFDDWALKIYPRAILVAGKQPVFSERIWQYFLWNGLDQNHVVVPLNRWYRYAFSLEDTLGREFYAPTDSVYLQEKRTIRRQEVFGAAKFAKVEPVYQFYWDRLMEIAEEMRTEPDLRLRFEGHACAVGPSIVNERLSLRRAQRFTEAFLERYRTLYPAYYQNILSRIEKPLGYGEKQPLHLKLKEYGPVLLGDNMSPVGRYLNRRIMVLLYREQ